MQVSDKSPPKGRNAATRPRGSAATDEQSMRSDQNAGPRAPIAARVGVPTVYMLLGNLFTLVVGLPFQIYVARVLGAAGVGVYGLLEGAMVFVSGLMAFGIGQTVMRFVPEHLARQEFGEAVGLVRGGGLLLLAAGALAYAVLLLLLPWIGTAWPWAEAYRWEVAIMGLMIPLSLLASFVQLALRGFQEIRSIVVGLSVFQLVVKVLFTLGAFALGLGLVGYMLASVSAMLCGCAWLFYSLVKQIRALPTTTSTLSSRRKWMRFAIAVYSRSLLDAASSGLDRFVLGAFSGASAVGVLIVVRQMQMLPERFNQMLLVIGAPLFSAAHGGDNRAERQHIHHLMTDWVVRSSLPLAFFLCIFARDVLGLYGPVFADAGTVPLQILVAALAVTMLFGPIGNIAWMSGLEWQSLWISVMNTLLFGAGLVVLIPQFGLIGLALAYALAAAFERVTTMILVRRRLGIRWWSRRYLEWPLQWGAVCAVGFTALSLRKPLNAAELAVCLVAIYAAAIGVTFLRGLHEDDKQLLGHIGQAVRARRNPERIA